MGGRGCFVDVNSNNFAFIDDGQTFFSIGMIDDIRILERPGKSVKAPEISHTENRIYAVVQNGQLKHLAFYDESHNQIRSVDFSHPHGWNRVQPHVHYNLQHINEEPGTPPSSSDIELAEKVNSWLKHNIIKGK